MSRRSMMERYQIDRKRAFQDTNEKLRDVAAGIAEDLDDSTRQATDAATGQPKQC